MNYLQRIAIDTKQTVQEFLASVDKDEAQEKKQAQNENINRSS